MRRYWHPVAAAVQMEGNPMRKGRILGEDLGLFRDCSGNLGLIEPRCLYRAMHLAFGIPEEVGLWCPYPGTHSQAVRRGRQVNASLRATRHNATGSRR